MASMDTQHQDTSYNGWTNYPTWCVDLWLSNDEGLYNEALDYTRNGIDRANPDFGGNGNARYAVSHNLKEWVTDDLTPDLGASFPADLLGWALDQVNWHEIADSWIETAADQ